MQAFKSTPRIIWVISGFVLLLIAVFGLDVNEWVRGGHGWRWQYIPVEFERVLPLIISTMIYFIGALLFLRWSRWRNVLIPLWGIIGAIVLSLAVTHAREGDAFFALFTRTASGLTTGQHWSATQIDWSNDDWLAWTTVMADLGGHISTAPPGLSMLYGGLNDLLDNSPITAPLHEHFLLYQCHNYNLLAYSPAQWASSLFGMLMPLWAGLTVIPLYGASRRLFKDQRYVLYTVLSWAIVPGLLSFAGSWSTAFPFFSAMAFWYLLIGLESKGLRQAVWCWLAGLMVGLAVFINFAFLPILGLFGLYTLGYFAIKTKHPFSKDSFLPALLVGVYFGLGLILPWLIFWLAGGSTFFEVLQASFDAHLELDRPLWFWAGMHVWDWAIFSGLGLALLWLAGIGHWMRNRQTTSIPLLSITLLITILIMTLSGTTRGESGRIWLFMSPFLLMSGIDGLRRLSTTQGASPKWAWRWITAVDLGMMLVLTANLFVISTGMTEPPSAPIVETDRAVYARFSSVEHPVFDLTSWGSDIIETDEGRVIRLNLNWRGVNQPTEATLFGAFLINPAGEVENFTNWQPNEQGDYLYPTTCWTPHTQIGDTIDLPLPDDAQAGEWWISLAVFGEQTTDPEGRLSVEYTGNADDVQVGLGPIVIEQ